MVAGLQNRERENEGNRFSSRCFVNPQSQSNPPPTGSPSYGSTGQNPAKNDAVLIESTGGSVLVVRKKDLKKEKVWYAPYNHPFSHPTDSDIANATWNPS